jgi:hypothetical protein
MLYYLHIPKSAGTSVRTLFSSIYGPRLVEVYQDVSKDYTESLARVCQEESVLFGHFCFSLHELLRDPKPSYISLVRHPLERVTSWFKHQLRDRTSRFGGPLHRGDLSPKQIVDQGLAPEVNNHSVRMICASYRRVTLYKARDAFSRNFLGKRYYQFDSEQHLRQALNNIDRHFAFITTVEKQSKLVHWLAQQNNVTAAALNIPTENTSPADLEIDLDKATTDAILRANKLDLKLYDRLM